MRITCYKQQATCYASIAAAQGTGRKNNSTVSSVRHSYHYHAASCRWFPRCWWPGLAPLLRGVKPPNRRTLSRRSSITFSFCTAAADHPAKDSHHTSLRLHPPHAVFVVWTKPGQGVFCWDPPCWPERWRWSKPVPPVKMPSLQVFKTRWSWRAGSALKHGPAAPVLYTERQLPSQSADVEERGRNHRFDHVYFSVANGHDTPSC